MRKLREKWVEIIKNSGEMVLKILYEPFTSDSYKIFLKHFHFVFLKGTLGYHF